MALLSLDLLNFRNHVQTSISAGLTGFHVFFGENGSGKTSLLEAIYYLSHGRSFRTNKIEPLIYHEADTYFLRAVVNHDLNEMSIGTTRNRCGDAKWHLNHTHLNSPQELFRLLPTKLLNTHSYVLLEGEPKFRRQLLNWGVFYTQPLFYEEWKRYTRALKQRNELLKAKSDHSILNSWKQILVTSGEKISLWHREYLEKLIPYLMIKLQSYHLPLLEFDYIWGWDKQLSLMEAFEMTAERELRYGYTSVGVHRCDLLIQQSGLPVHQVLSRGQQKRLLCAIMLAQGELLQKSFGIAPIYLIDDLMAELDSSAGQIMMEHLSESQTQIFLTAIDKNHLADLFPKGIPLKMFHVEHGQVEAIG